MDEKDKKKKSKNRGKTKDERQLNERANKYKITDRGWWYNTDVHPGNPKGVPSIAEGLIELHRKRPLKSYFGFKKGGKVKHFRDNKQHN